MPEKSINKNVKRELQSLETKVSKLNSQIIHLISEFERTEDVIIIPKIKNGKLYLEQAVDIRRLLVHGQPKD